MSEVLTCWNCAESLSDVPKPISRHAHCDACSEVLHCCRQCRHFDSRQKPFCDEDSADPPLVKETANFCEYFEPSNPQSSASDLGAAASSKLDELFDEIDSSEEEESRSDTQPGKSDDAADQFNNLFSD